MEISKKTEITLKPEEVEKIIKEHFRTAGIKIDHVYFNVDGVEDPSDWRAEYPLSYELTKVRCIGEDKH